MDWRRIASGVLVALSIVAVPAGSAAAAGPHRADGQLADWTGEPTMLSGETRVSNGELIYDDWLYDDYGADLDQAANRPAFRGALAPTQGDYRYPTDAARYGYNAADLRQLRVAADGYGLHLVVFLQTMKTRMPPPSRSRSTALATSPTPTSGPTAPASTRRRPITS